jgi:hypothetical protein
MCCLTVFVSGNRMLLCFFVLSHFVMMDSFAVLMCRCLVMPGCIVMVLTGGVFQWHEMRPFKKACELQNYRRSSVQEDLLKTLVAAASRIVRCG